jgi:hypothetical protein
VRGECSVWYSSPVVRTVQLLSNYVSLGLAFMYRPNCLTLKTEALE